MTWLVRNGKKDRATNLKKDRERAGCNEQGQELEECNVKNELEVNIDSRSRGQNANQNFD